MNHTRTGLVLASVLLAGCGVEPGMEEEGAEGVEAITQAAQILNSCAQGEDPNAIENPAWGDTYTRTASTINNCSRPTTIVDINGVANTKYRIASFATFSSSVPPFLCPLAYVHARVMKKVGSSWVQVNSSSDKAISTWNGSRCYAQVQRILVPSDYSASGDYRVRARAYRPDGTYETITVASSTWQ